jgi:hypothetical protein
MRHDLFWTALAAWACATTDAATVALTASEGGRIELSDGAALEVPPGALEADGAVTFARRSCERVFGLDEFESCLYAVDAGDVGWAGRFRVELPRRTRRGPATAARDAEDGLRPLVDSEDGGVVTASSSQSGLFVARSVEGAPDDRCTDPPFVPCGGDLDGTWSLASACGTVEQLFGYDVATGKPYAACEADAALVDYPWDLYGSVTFGADGTFFESVGGSLVEHRLVSLECLERVGESCHSACRIVDDLCDCRWDVYTFDTSTELEWSASGTELTMGTSTDPYCVQGDVLGVLSSRRSGDPFMTYYVRR